MALLTGPIFGRLLILVTLLFVVVSGDDSQRSTATFINFSQDEITLFWQDTVTEESKEKEVKDIYEVGKIASYESTSETTFVGHSFQYKNDKSSVEIVIKGDHPVHPIGLRTKTKEKRRLGEKNVEESQSEILVTCSTTEGDIRMHITPESSPFGAARFLKLVSDKYYDGCALNRAVDGFLTQFGISSNYKMRTDMRTRNIPDDFSSNTTKVHFKPGFLSYAGSGPNSRSTEIFVVMHNAPQQTLNHFGPHTNPWETPFGYIESFDVENVVSKWYTGYGDMPPWGSGPDPQLIYKEDGYETYLKNDFPLMSYIHSCKILNTIGEGDEDEEEL